jgi:hypothetical protein
MKSGTVTSGKPHAKQRSLMRMSDGQARSLEFVVWERARLAAERKAKLSQG